MKISITIAKRKFKKVLREERDTYPAHPEDRYRFNRLGCISKRSKAVRDSGAYLDAHSI